MTDKPVNTACARCATILCRCNGAQCTSREPARDSNGRAAPKDRSCYRRARRAIRLTARRRRPASCLAGARDGGWWARWRSARREPRRCYVDQPPRLGGVKEAVREQGEIDARRLRPRARDSPTPPPEDARREPNPRLRVCARASSPGSPRWLGSTRFVARQPPGAERDARHRPAASGGCARVIARHASEPRLWAISGASGTRMSARPARAQLPRAVSPITSPGGSPAGYRWGN